MRICRTISAAVLVSAGAACAAAPLTTLTVENLADRPRPAGPITFGMIFARDDAPGPVKAGTYPTQCDIKRRWPDGSIKHAVLTVALPRLEGKGRLRLPLIASAPPAQTAPARKSTSPPPPPEHLPQVEVAFRIHGGPRETATLARALADTKKPRIWLAGPLVREYHFKTIPRDEKGRPDLDLEVRFRLRHYPGTETSRIALVVENCHWRSPGNIPYDVIIRIAGKPVYECKNAGKWSEREFSGRYARYLGHPKGTRWIKRFWVGRRLDDLHIRYDVPYLVRTGLLPPYDPKVRVPERILAKLAARWTKNPARDILQHGFILPYFPTTGGRPDIGPLPRWTARYLLSQDPRAKAVVLGNGDLSGSCPVHLREAATDWYTDIDRHPTYSHNPRGTRERVKPRDTSTTPWVMPPKSHFTVDAAHQPSLAYVPYLITGDYYYLEEMCFWAAHNLVAINYAYRRGAAGLLTPNQVRGVAWTLRNLLHAAALAPDGSKEKAYFEAKLQNNIAHLSALATGPEASPIGIYKPGAHHAYTRGWPPEWRNRYFSIPPGSTTSSPGQPPTSPTRATPKSRPSATT